MDGSDYAAWHEVGTLDDIPKLGARVVETARGPVAVFRTADDQVFALDDACPHKSGRLSMGIVHGHSVTCPLHGWVLALPDGQAQAPDVGCARSFSVRLDGRRVFLCV